MGAGVSDALLDGDSIGAQSATVESLAAAPRRRQHLDGRRGDRRRRAFGTLARHRDILGEFTQEFKRVKRLVEQDRDHSSLLGGARRSDGVGGGEFGASSAGS